MRFHFVMNALVSVSDSHSAPFRHIINKFQITIKQYRNKSQNQTLNDPNS